MFGGFGGAKAKEPARGYLVKNPSTEHHQVIIKDLFYHYIESRSLEMDSKSFMRLANDCQFITRKCSSTDIESIFDKVLDKNGKKIIISQFETALEKIAKKRGESISEFKEHIYTSGARLIGEKKVVTTTHYSSSKYEEVHETKRKKKKDSSSSSDE
jgi:hypothetical protein